MLLLYYLLFSSPAFAQERPTGVGWLTTANGIAFFTATDSVHGTEFWRTDGTAAGTYLVKDLKPGGESSYPHSLTNVNGTLYFVCNNFTIESETYYGSYETGYEIWKSDGTTEGTMKVNQVFHIVNDRSRDFQTLFHEIGNTVFYIEPTSSNQYHLVKTDGTQAGTVRLGLFYGYGYYDYENYSFATLNNLLYFPSLFPPYGNGIWKSNGTKNGTVLVKEFPHVYDQPNPYKTPISYLITSNNSLFFRGDTETNGRELWKSDGTTAGTTLVKDIVSGTGSSSPKYLTSMNNILYFTADNGTNGRELWRSDGTEPGTMLVKDIFVGAGSSEPASFTTINGVLYFTAYNATYGRELWKSDGTTSGTLLVKDIISGVTDSNPENLTNINGVLFFSTQTDKGGVQLWKSDGTAQGTTLVKTIHEPNEATIMPLISFTTSNGKLIFITDSQLWKSDGSKAGTVPVFGPISCSATGSILQEKWLNVTGYSVGAIPLNTSPSSSAQLTSFETSPNQGDNYGERIRGYLCAPYSGNYTFYLSGDDQCELYLSSDEDPTKKVKIASVATYSGNKEWNKFSSQKSASLSLVAGKKYYIEALHKEATGGDHLAVGWQTPAQSAITVIAGSYLSPFIASCSNAAQSSLVVNPSSGSILSGTSLYLKTIPGASSYTLQVSTSANFTTGVITKTTTSRLSTGTFYASFPELSLNQKYYVRVYTNLGLCWGPVTSFTTASAAGSAYVVNPSDGATTTGTSLYLNTVPGATTYTLQVSTSADFSTGVINRSTASRLSTGTYYAVFAELALNQKYYVRVKTNLSDTWGRTTSFTRVNATARLAASEESVQQSLESKVNLYPNPFEDKLTLVTEHTGKHSIHIVDNLGRTVYQATTQGNQTELNLAHLKQGVYVLKLSTEEGQTQIIKVVKK
ncbi:T9SS type A sorting domain-containing protein [Rhodocytophaga rosea]|uniref:T9SS type A sorting domain-containing protein n=1 Tax=Rhodocytophaga rosea TaxID=2704465 RepID=A0A6C0GRF6_9BACT|nr:ELWxxDGT repeat protein [Rhodocytophaga rosea]QHT70454.1 T9SS type A sorting domain-containing protein [Rhodocytophaga rosea]